MKKKEKKMKKWKKEKAGWEISEKAPPISLFVYDFFRHLYWQVIRCGYTVSSGKIFTGDLVTLVDRSLGRNATLGRLISAENIISSYTLVK